MLLLYLICSDFFFYLEMILNINGCIPESIEVIMRFSHLFCSYTFIGLYMLTPCDESLFILIHDLFNLLMDSFVSFCRRLLDLCSLKILTVAFVLLFWYCINASLIELSTENFSSTIL